MSQRPRLAGDGVLRVPERVALYWNDYLRGRLSAVSVDPFDWTSDRLLLAESVSNSYCSRNTGYSSSITSLGRFEVLVLPVLVVMPEHTTKSLPVVVRDARRR